MFTTKRKIHQMYIGIFQPMILFFFFFPVESATTATIKKITTTTTTVSATVKSQLNKFMIEFDGA